MEKEDARVRRSKERIREEFLLLLREKPVRRITVKELCQRCQINRTTFYKYYADPYDVLEQLERNALAYHRQELEKHLPGTVNELFRELLTEAKTYSNLYYVLFSENGDPQLPLKMIQVCDDLAYPLVEQRFPSLPEWQRRLLHRYLSQGSSGVIAGWISGGMVEPVEEVTQLIERMCQSIAAGFSEPARMPPQAQKDGQ